MSRGRPSKENKEKIVSIAMPESVMKDFKKVQEAHSETIGFEINNKQMMQVLLHTFMMEHEIF
jgi:hypothetical protein